jgi:hypothetical protein
MLASVALTSRHDTGLWTVAPRFSPSPLTGRNQCRRHLLRHRRVLGPRRRGGSRLSPGGRVTRWVIRLVGACREESLITSHPYRMLDRRQS